MIVDHYFLFFFFAFFFAAILAHLQSGLRAGRTGSSRERKVQGNSAGHIWRVECGWCIDFVTSECPAGSTQAWNQALAL